MESFIDYHETPRGVCWWLGLCSYWNPPLDIIVEGAIKVLGKNPCIKCWKWKKQLPGELSKEEYVHYKQNIKEKLSEV